MQVAAGEPELMPGPGNRRASRRLGWSIVPAAALVVLILAICIEFLPATVGSAELADQPTATPVTTPTTTLAPSVGSAPPSVARGWPTIGGNQPGDYSWDGTCVRIPCNVGFMNGGPVAIHFDYAYDDASQYWPALPIPELPSTDDGLTAVTVAGHEGIHRRIDALREEWIVEIEGLTISIRLIAKPGTSHTDLAEAYAIIDSLRTEPMETYRRFRLVFTIPTGWDSG